MPVKPPNERVFNYDVKFDPEVIKQQTEKRRAVMLAKQEAAQAELTALEDRVKVVLGSYGVPTTTYPSYLNFCRELWKKARKFHDQTLAKEALLIQQKWQARELKQNVLDGLRHDVFGIKDPTP